MNEAQEDQSRRHGPSKDPVTALDKVEAWIDPLRKAAAQKRAQVAGEELLERLGRAEPMLTVCPETGASPPLSTTVCCGPGARGDHRLQHAADRQSAPLLRSY